MEFKVGDKAVFPALGVGIIKEIEHTVVEGAEYEMYVLEVLANGSTIRVPVPNATAVGLRPVIPEESVDKVLEVLSDRDTPARKQTWNRRQREYDTKVLTGDALEVAHVLRELLVLRAGKTLSFGERRMFDKTHALIVQELAAARDVDEGVIEQQIEELYQD